MPVAYLKPRLWLPELACTPTLGRGARMGKKHIMAFPHANISAGASLRRRSVQAVGHHVSPCRTAEGDHQLEKLEFALAVALSRGDLQRSAQLRAQIEALGGNHEEPGT